MIETLNDTERLVLIGERETPDLLALFCTVVGEELVESCKQISLGDSKIDGDLDTETVLQFDEPGSQSTEMGVTFFAAEAEQIGDAQC